MRTYTRTGIKSSAAGTDCSWAKESKFIMVWEALTTHWSLSPAVLYALMQIISACALGQGHSYWYSCWKVESEVTAFDDVEICFAIKFWFDILVQWISEFASVLNHINQKYNGYFLDTWDVQTSYVISLQLWLSLSKWKMGWTSLKILPNGFL